MKCIMFSDQRHLLSLAHARYFGHGTPSCFHAFLQSKVLRLVKKLLYREVHNIVCGVFPNPSLGHARYFCKLAQDMGFFL